MTSRDIRSSYLKFFQDRGHRIVPSAPVVPHGDSTLLFTNAGMNQFKDVFLGLGTRDYTRAADTQKCIRVSGKHNDLEEVGYDTYHHTFFEMLGNWSFGDYYKQEAIQWSWELLTDVWNLPTDRLYATVYKTDDESFDIWRKHLPERQILRFDDADNFWEMGETGPCGPCTEIHFDRTIDKSGRDLVNRGVQDVIEVWNNVFIQYNRKADRSLEDLASKHVDTGMGFERICAVIQETPSNYETDVFLPIIGAIETMSSRQYDRRLTDPTGVAMRVISDHIRTLSFAIADGATPGNEGRGYVLRRILRRASRYARTIDFKEPVMYKLVDVLASTMGDVFPELTEHKSTIERIIKAEEESFLQTLERGLERVTMIVQKDYHSSLTGISGDDAFQLYDTYGFPLDLTQLLAKEYGLSVDTHGFDIRMSEQRERSRMARKSTLQEVESVEITTATKFLGYNELVSDSTVLWVDENKIVLDQTPMYVESGGQQSDTGTLTLGGENYPIIDVRKINGVYVHICDRDIEPLVGDIASIRVNSSRRWDIQRHHTATHLLHEAARIVLGSHVKQSGSLVAPHHLRFDIAHFEKISRQQLNEIEAIVNEKILERIPIITHELPLEKAKKIPNVKMFFGDKYGDFVRVVTIDENFSSEFCGGTHVENTNDIGLLKITSESAIASGVRRIEAVTGRHIAGFIQNLEQLLDTEKSHQHQLADKIKILEKELSQYHSSKLAEAIPAMIARGVQIQGMKVVSAKVSVGDIEQLKTLGDSLRMAFREKGIGLLVAEFDDKANIVCVVTDDLVSHYQAGKIAGSVAKELGGGGGGKPHLATAGGKLVENIPAVIEQFPLTIETWIS